MTQRKFAVGSVLLALACMAGPLLAHDSDGTGARQQLVVFGDSLSDPGNYFALYHQVSLRPFEPVPDAPYAIGGLHYSNGATWVERLGHSLGAEESAGPAFRRSGDSARNFAVGRARARPGAAEFPYYDLSTQVSLFLDRTGNRASPDALYVIWIGANDLKDALSTLSTDPSFATAVGIIQQSVGTTAANVQALWAAGARRFLILDMPNLGSTPVIASLGPTAQYAGSQLTSAYNGGLHQAEAALGVLPGIQVTSFDVNVVLARLIADPASAGLVSTSTPCLRFWVIEQAVCRHPEQYLFWDGIHPTSTGHTALAEGVLAAVTVH